MGQKAESGEQKTDKTKATRTAYGETLLELGKKRTDIVVLDAELG